MDQNNRTEYVDKSIKKLRNSLIASFLFLVVAVAIFSAQTYAYFWDTKSAGENRIESGSMDIEILEVQDGGQETESGIPTAFLPGTVVNKTFKVKNTGDIPVFIRIKIEKTVLDTDEDELPEGWEALISCDFKLDDLGTQSVEGLWVYRDGYYYYNERIESGSITSSLFDKIRFSTEIGNEFTCKEIEFKVICQAVQANGNTGDPLTAWGWPTE